MMPTAEEARRGMIDFLRYQRKYIPISKQRDELTRVISMLRGLMKHPERLRQHRNQEEE